MPVGSLLTGILTPLIVNSLLGKGANNGPISVEEKKMTTMQQPTFNVNFYNQDTNNNQDTNDVHDNGNLNYQQGNSHLSAQGNLHQTRGQIRTPHYGSLGQPHPFLQRPFVYGPQPNPYAYPFNPYVAQLPSLQSPQNGYLTPHSLNPHLQPRPSFINSNFASLTNLHPQVPSSFYPSPQHPTHSRQAQPSNLLPQVQELTRKVELLLKQARDNGQEEEANKRLEQFVQSGGTEETLNELLELAKDPLYDPSKDPNFDPLAGSPNYEELPFYTEDPAFQDTKFNPVSALGASNIRYSRRKRDVEGKFGCCLFL